MSDMYELGVRTSDATAESKWALRERWDERAVTYGGWCSIPSTFCAELMAVAGYDWVCVDTQHGVIGYQQMLAMLQALDARRTPALVRVQWNDPSAIMKALDAGAVGVVVPMVNSPADAEAAVRAVRYPPLGQRSWGPTRASLGDPDYTPERVNANVICCIMLETVEAIEQADEILAVPGIDGVYLGPWDLSLSITGSKPAPAATPRDRELIARVRDACDRHGVVAGIACAGPEDARRWRSEGFQMLAVQSDHSLLGRAAASALETARELG